jgi:hypothetical protein
MHLMMAVKILGSAGAPTLGLQQLVRLHLMRIAPTIQYAIAQDNNHGTSEAVALFMGGSWLDSLGDPKGAKWATIGRKLLENRVARLTGDQGTFSQYSLNYHRVLLDTLCMAEVWRSHLSLPAFSELFQNRALAASKWLYSMIQASNGDGPNVGANDGARLLQLSNTTYRDYRPSVQLGMALFANQRAYLDGDSLDEPLRWLKIPIPKVLTLPSDNLIADDGGFAILRRNDAMAMLRYPRFKFRPSQADTLHLDLWVSGKNLLRDAGTYSYNTDPEWMNYFGGTASHNTIQFDGRDQMPRLSRFLFGDWLKTSFYESLTVTEETTQFGAGYRDSKMVKHLRRISLGNHEITISDEVEGFKKKAVLRWRLMPGNWRLDHNNGTVILTIDSIESSTGGLSKHVITIDSSATIFRCELIEGWESRHYLEKTSLPVLEIEIKQPGTINTYYHWNS